MWWCVPTVNINAKPPLICFLLQHQRQRRKSLSRFVDNWQCRLGLPKCWHCTTCMYMSYLNESDFSFKNICKLAKHAETRKNVWEKSNDMYPLLVRVKTMLNCILICFIFTTKSMSKKMSSSEREHNDVSRVVWTLIDNSKLAHQTEWLAVIVVKNSQFVRKWNLTNPAMWLVSGAGNQSAHSRWNSHVDFFYLLNKLAVISDQWKCISIHF